MKEPVENTSHDPSDSDSFDLTAHSDDLDLFAEELEDRFNADGGSTFSSASTALSCFTTASTLCCFLGSTA